MKLRPEILFEDEDLILINKPANYLSIPDRYDPTIPNIQGFLKRKYEAIFTVHRLDKETSGIMLFAKNEIAHKALNAQFENREVKKIYQAVVAGQTSEPSGTIDKSIARHPAQPGRMIISNKGKKALTDYKVIEQFGNYSLLEVQIHTGRTHQIRVHLQAIGVPLAVDSIYGHKPAFYLSSLKGKKYKRPADHEERPLISRSSLHAKQLSFNHPRSQEKLEFEAALPKDFSALLNQLRKWN